MNVAVLTKFLHIMCMQMLRLSTEQIHTHTHQSVWYKVEQKAIIRHQSTCHQPWSRHNDEARVRYSS